MTERKRKSQFLRRLEAKRDAARRESEEAGEPEAEAPPSRVLRERPAPLFPAKKRRPPWK